MPLAVDLMVEHDAWLIDWTTPAVLHGRLEDWVRGAADEARAGGAAVPDDAEVSLVLGDDAASRALNRAWRGIDAPTNVLSFPAAAPVRTAMLGDIVVAYETCRREAAERGTPLADYLAHLVVHGALHLLGYDHEQNAEAERMEAAEVRALAAFGIGSPYADDAADLRSTP